MRYLFMGPPVGPSRCRVFFYDLFLYSLQTCVKGDSSLCTKTMLTCKYDFPSTRHTFFLTPFVGKLSSSQSHRVPLSDRSFFHGVSTLWESGQSVLEVVYARPKFSFTRRSSQFFFGLTEVAIHSCLLMFHEQVVRGVWEVARGLLVDRSCQRYLSNGSFPCKCFRGGGEVTESIHRGNFGQKRTPNSFGKGMTTSVQPKLSDDIPPRGGG